MIPVQDWICPECEGLVPGSRDTCPECGYHEFIPGNQDPIKGPLDPGQDKGTNASQGDGPKIHRVRLTDKEIRAIAEALTLLKDQSIAEANGKGTRWDHGGPDYARIKFLENLAHRFRSWGTPYYGYERPYYSRPRRS